MSFPKILVLLLAASSFALAQPAKKLIEFGWDEPDTTFIRKHIQEMRQTPFDGTVFHVSYRYADGHLGNFTWEGWGTNAFVRADLAAAIEDLKQTDFGKFGENFLRFNTTPAKLDWFDDYSAVIQNARLAAHFARETKCPGILFDIEQYEGQLFDYRKQRDAYHKSKPNDQPGKSWELYATQARRRGGEVMAAFQEAYPGLTIFLTFGYSLPWAESSPGRLALAECHYGLLAPFLDGMVATAKGKTRLVDGHELSYSWKKPEQFAAGSKTMKQDLLPIVLDPAKYQQCFSIGFGLWLDHDWRKLGWNAEDPSKNYFTPQSFEAAAGAALQQTDQYVWIYTETPRWWSEDGKPIKLHPEYFEALRQARQTTESKTPKR
jgi:hypothetical protein